MKFEEFPTLRWGVEDGIGLIQINRPDSMNSLNAAMKVDLRKVFLERAKDDERVKVLVITGVGDRAFCAGADIKEKSQEDVPPAKFFHSQRATHQLFREIEEFEKPTIAAINGVALGGGLELALCCDIRMAAQTARFGLPEAKLGVIPAAGGTQRLPRVVGESMAKQMIFTAAILGAEEAFRIGLVSTLVEGEKLLPTAIGMAAEMAKLPPLAIRLAKRCINRGLQTDIDSGLEYERYAASILIDTDDRKEGMRAFVEKRSPQFQGT